MNYLCCPIACLIAHVRYVWDRTTNPNNERWVSLEESYQTPPVTRSTTSSFFQPAQNDQPVIATNPIPAYKN